MAVTPNKFGPGTFTLGPVDTPIIDVSCQVQSLTVEWDNDEEDPINVLCGDSVSGGMSFTASVNGTILQDLQNDETDGIVAYSWAHKGETVDFTFTPNSAIGTTVTGQCTLIPLSVGGEDYGTTMTSEFEWPCVGEPVLTPAAAPETVEV
ncbi:hypothetical protein ACIRJS_16580 [Streptomyces sp. NPDC102340]|uniref:hypothetical protein n=1 Tax=unclassified Streptomyces TaxID=2593676 RepID=UPI003810F709